MSIYKLEITHNDIMVVDLETDDPDSVVEAVTGFEYELGEMISGAQDDHN
jgi:hypothetical protein